MPDATSQPLFDAVARGAGLVLSLPSPDGLLHCKSRFLGEDQHGLWVSASGDEAMVDQMINSGRIVGVSFRGGDVRHVFVTAILRRELYFELHEGVTTSALLLAFPAEVKAMQRRNSYRVRVPPESELIVRCWRMTRRAELHDKPLSAQQLSLDVRDISLGGLGVTFHGTEGEPPKVTPEDRLRLELKFGKIDLLIEGRMRATQIDPAATSFRTGIRFCFVQEGIEDRQTLTRLTRIVGDLQREEVRYQRMLAKSKPDAA
jgi:c-di-GMP-binding flagellar brake protein YcgR